MYQLVVILFRRLENLKEHKREAKQHLSSSGVKQLKHSLKRLQIRKVYKLENFSLR